MGEEHLAKGAKLAKVGEERVRTHPLCRCVIISVQPAV
jgi:hypothetical protein